MSAPSPRSFAARAKSWSLAHVFFMDVLWALLWFVLMVATWPLASASPTDSAAYLALTVGCCATLSARRVRPLTALAVLAALLALQVLWMEHFTTLSVICVLVATYTSQTELSAWWRRVVLVLLLLGTAVAVLFIPDLVYTESLGVRITSLLSAWTTLLLFALLGTVRRHNREEVDRLREHARLLRAKREQELRLATLGERTRIAREMHDVLAHSLNVIVAQADGGRYAARSSPEAAVTALETIGRVGRESAGELHRLLGVLREDREREVSPMPGLGELPLLVEEYRRTGLRVRLAQDDPPSREEASPPASVGLTVYRLVQQSLANALEHAGQVAVTVHLTRSPGLIVVTVTNPIGPESHEPGERDGGHGLIGMRERIALHGGDLEVGWNEGTDVWRVRASVPWEET
ncbi:sensor histidine kinase [Nocardiopsis sp. NPDC055551]